ncbi:MAG: hypothetical protein K0Q91_2292 [Fibrobacteria bacterium]|nr:hypothetical protein [Fibrobacteria bacterium]
MTRYSVSKTLGALALAVAGAWAQTPPNTLSSQEVAGGYENLFDGIEALNVKWYGITGNSQTSYSFTNSTPASWITTTENDYKVLQVSSGGQNHIATRDSTYRNFDLKVEWKVPTQGNSGIFLRFLKIASWGGASGSEVQVVDVAHSDGQQPLHRAGTNYDMFPLRTGQTNWFRPTGEWNEMRVIAYENRVAHYGNGIRLLEYDMNSTAYATAYAASKYRTYPRYKDIHAGSFYIQHHGETGIKYRSMRVKKFADSTQNPWAVGSPYRKPNLDELVDTLPMTTAMYAPVSIAPAGRRAADNVILTRENGALSLRFARQADYTIETRDLAGALVSRHEAVGVSQFSVPLEKTARTQVLSVSSNGKAIFSRLISPL